MISKKYTKQSVSNISKKNLGHCVMLTSFSLPFICKNVCFELLKGTQTIKDVKNKTMQLRTVLLLSILCVLPCCGFPCEYCNLYTKITCYFCYFTFYTKNTLHYIWLWRLLLWKNIIYRRNASRSGSWGQEIFYRVQNISYRLFDFFDILKQLSIVTICMSILK